MKRFFALLLFLALAVPLALAQYTLEHSKKYAKDHSGDYRVGVFQSTGTVDEGSFTSCNGGCATYSQGHNIHYVETPDGLYGIEAPTAVLASILLNSPSQAMMHKQWFMDDLHGGEKVLFAVLCNKHNNCEFWLPNPDKPGKEIDTQGFYRPRIAKTNTMSLCGTGKLAPAVEAEVCQAPKTPEATPATTTAPAPEAAQPAQTPAPAVAPPTAQALPMPPPTAASQPDDPHMAQFKRMCDSGMFAKQPLQQQICDTTFPKTK